MSKQTSVEWFATQLYEKFEMKGDGSIIDNLLEQAKEMHKQELGKTWDTALDKYEVRAGNYMRAYEDFDDYYQETFVNKGSDEVELPKHPSVISENGNELLFDKEGNLIKEFPKQDVDKLGNEDVPKLGYDVDKFATEWIDKNSHKWSNNTDEVGDNYGSFIAGWNKCKETLYTEEQVREAIQKARHSYAVSNGIIQSLKQPKKD